MKPPLFVICGPPGVGKGTIVTALCKDKWLNVVRTLSVTTRPPGAGERDGVDYHFISEHEFARLREKGALFGGTGKQYGYYYGIRLADIEEPRLRGQGVIVESNLRGVKLAKERFENVVAIFLLPPSELELRRRLIARGRDGVEGLFVRIKDGHDMLVHRSEYPIDHLILNHDLTECVDEVRQIIVVARR